MMVLSGNDTRILDKALEGRKAVVISKEEFGSATPKKLAFHCFHSGLRLYWSNNNYYFEKETGL